MRSGLGVLGCFCFGFVVACLGFFGFLEGFLIGKGDGDSNDDADDFFVCIFFLGKMVETSDFVYHLSNCCLTIFSSHFF